MRKKLNLIRCQSNVFNNEIIGKQFLGANLQNGIGNCF